MDAHIREIPSGYPFLETYPTWQNHDKYDRIRLSSQGIIGRLRKQPEWKVSRFEYNGKKQDLAVSVTDKVTRFKDVALWQESRTARRQ